MADERSRSEVLRRNERIKHGAGAATAWANALFIGAFGTWFVRGFGPYVFISLIVSLTIMLVASHSLNMLEAEPKDV